MSDTTLSPSAERQRRHRERQRRGAVFMQMQLERSVIDKLVVRGYLRRENQDDDAHVRTAFEGFLNQAISHIDRLAAGEVGS